MMSQNNFNIFDQLNGFIREISNYINKINEIILQMNAIIFNQTNCPMMGQINNLINNEINRMENFTNKNNEINYNFNANVNQCLKRGENMINYNKKTNILFKHDDGTSINIIIDEEKEINELINLYFEKIEKPEFANNYKMKYYFIEGTLGSLEKYKNRKIKDILKNGHVIFAKKIGYDLINIK